MIWFIHGSRGPSPVTKYCKKCYKIRPYKSRNNKVSNWGFGPTWTKKQKLAVAMRFRGRSRQTSTKTLRLFIGICCKIGHSVLKGEKKIHTTEAYSNFDSIYKETMMSMANYTEDFEQRYNWNNMQYLITKYI